jgi:ATP-dependent DNA helicase PIF1
MSIELSNEQQIIIDKCIRGENMFVTGSGGCGKSLIIRILKNIYMPSRNIDDIRHITDRYRNIEYKNIQVCALTGVASVLLQCSAKTIHSFSGIGISNASNEQILKKIKNSSFYRKNWKETDILIIDEVSMMSQHMFELLDYLGKNIRRNARPFGGIQIIMFGDFFQLPPVSKDAEDKLRKNFCFESELWFETFSSQNHMELIKIFRQSDENFKKILNQIREGKIRRNVNDFLLNYVNRDKTLEIIQPTKLYPKRSQVDYINSFEMDKLEGDIHEYEISNILNLSMTEKQKLLRDTFTPEQIANELNYLQGNIPCEKKISLKIGSQVMSIVNLNLNDINPICNGSQGVILRFDENNNPVIKFSSGFEYTMLQYVWASETIPGIGVRQLPIILAWALTIHKSQGATMDAIEVDAGSGIFECGQTYVALSRVKSLEGLYLSAFDVTRIKINRKVQEFYERMRKMKLDEEENNLLNNQIIQESKNNFKKFEYKGEENKTEEKEIKSDIKIVRITPTEKKNETKCSYDLYIL